jgi:hypothetical protein
MMTTSKLGVPASDLTDADLERELLQMYRTREETFLMGSADALRTHTDRMLELEHEYASRFPEKVRPDRRRTRRGARSSEPAQKRVRSLARTAEGSEPDDEMPRTRPPSDS